MLEDWGFQFVHFNLKCAALDSLPSEISEQKLREIRTQFEIRDLEMVALSGTFNAIDPNLERRKENIRKCRLLIEEAPSLGTHVVTLCTGTRDSDNMWKGTS